MSRVKPQAVEYEDGKVRLRSEIEATIPTEQVKLRDGPFNGVSTLVPVGELRLLITQHQISTWSRPDVAFEYQRDPHPQFTFTGHKEFQQSEELKGIGQAVDDSDYREGFLAGLHRAISLLFLEDRKRHPDCGNVVDAIRNIAEQMGYQTNKLYQFYPGDEKELERK